MHARDDKPASVDAAGDCSDLEFKPGGRLQHQRSSERAAFRSSHTHPNSNIDVLGINLSPQVFADLLLAQELFEKLGAVFEVVAADPPLPRFPMLDAGGFVTRAPLHSARAARFGKRVGQRCRRHCQQEGSLLKRCGDKTHRIAEKKG